LGARPAFFDGLSLRDEDMWYAYVPRFAAIFLALMLTSVVVAPGSAWAQSPCFYEAIDTDTFSPRSAS
jgi:hypothetical protein